MFKYLTLEQVEQYVADNKNARWNGWSVEVFTPKAHAQYDKKGSYNREQGRWGYIYTVTPNAQGKYRIKK